ncbi:mannose-1-phosphate guanylyltransferase [Nematocida major]|uniref:mannose-1-phosphate guanylyltransferase n=1 Tax=Nematocida major TaxID=1912982 RepID=UPI002008ADE6|nr:mannose-1-phosphate guanylyltransferase [Nematocida major]KAH9385240.1 mannose-1-phosphate guanylyltransferase [Nematocida major]
MKGIILVGGMGTRLQPLTHTQPKPLIPFANKPILKHQIEALVEAGVTEVILAVGHMQENIKEYLHRYEQDLGVKITYSVESSPMGTAGPLALLREVLKNERKPFFVLNSDVICKFPFSEMLESHRKHGGDGTILATKVEAPEKYGVIVSDADARMVQFVEKPEKFVGNRINAGVYIFGRNVLNYIQDKPMSIEKDVLPHMIKHAIVKTFDLKGFWMDIGQPKDYVLGNILYHQNNPDLSMIDKTARISPGAMIGKNTTIGPGVEIEEGVEIENSIVFEGACIKKNALIVNSIIGWGAVVGRWSRIEDYSVLGANVSVQEGIYITGGKIQPNTLVNLHVLLHSPRPSEIGTEDTPVA